VAYFESEQSETALGFESCLLSLRTGDVPRQAAMSEYRVFFIDAQNHVSRAAQIIDAPMTMRPSKKRGSSSTAKT